MNEVVHYRPSACERCQTALPQAPQADDPEPTWHQVAEVPLAPAVVTEHQAHGSHCPDCAHCTWAEIPALWTFARVDGVEPTNNHAERTLRRAVILRSSGQGFGNHSDAGCRFTERLLTVVQTLRLQHRPVLDYLRQAVPSKLRTSLAHRATSPAPVLCAVGV